MANQIILERRTELIKSLEQDSFNIHQFTPYHFRVIHPDSKNIIDIYPVNLKWHNIRTGERDRIDEEKDIPELIISVIFHMEFCE